MQKIHIVHIKYAWGEVGGRGGGGRPEMGQVCQVCVVGDGTVHKLEKDWRYLSFYFSTSNRNYGPTREVQLVHAFN